MPIIGAFHTMREVFAAVELAIGLISGSGFFLAGSELYKASSRMSTISSVSGNTVAEAYYQQAGEQGLAYPIALFACGLATIAVSLGFFGYLLSTSAGKTKVLEDCAEKKSNDSLSIVS